MSVRDMSAPDWRAWAEASPAMKREGGEWHGPCPRANCGGEDRFRVSRRTGRAYCRQCCPDGRNTDALRAIEIAAGLRSAAPNGRDWMADPPRQAAEDSMSDAEFFRGNAPPAPPPRDNRAFAAKTWHTAQDGESAPMRQMLTVRGLWPPGRPLPPVMRWLAREHAARAGIKLNGWPEAAAGAIVYAFKAGTVPVAIQLEALDSDGARHAWTDSAAKRKSLGPTSGASFRLRGAGRVLHISESPSSALAVNTWTGAPAWCSAGAGVLPSLASDIRATRAERVTIEADHDPAGRKYALALQSVLLGVGRDCRIRWASAGADPADDVTAAWAERLAILEGDGLAPHEAARQAWRDCPPPPTPETDI